jgi:hypothetical protein
MAAGTFSFTIEKGTTFSLPITWYSTPPDPIAEPPVEGVPINLTGFTARMQVRATIDSPTILHSFTTENGGIVLGGAAGTVTLQASATITAGWSWTQGVYDLEIVSAGGIVTRLLKGTITLDPEVTRDA